MCKGADSIVSIVIGPDDQPGEPAWSCLVCIDLDYVENSWGRGKGPRPTPYGYTYTDDWLAFLRRHCRLPRPVKEAGLRWADARVTPYGWSRGAGHAPQGIRVQWRIS